jgi:hypothetical protein
LGIDGDKVLSPARSEEDEAQRVLRILPHIAYIRQPEAIEFLWEYLRSDKTLPPIDGIRIPYAQWVLHLLIPCLEGFPIQARDARNYKTEEIELARQWMTQQKEWKIRR